MNYIYRWDDWLFTKVNSSLRCKFLNKIMPGFTFLGGARFTVLVGLILILQSGGFAGIGKEVGLALAGSHLLVQIVKRFVTRPRPFLVLPMVNTWKTLILKDYSFPSGHTTAGFALAIVLSINFHVFAPLFVLMAMLIGFSRMYLGLHYPTDVFVGAVIGTVSAVVSCF